MMDMRSRLLTGGYRLAVIALLSYIAVMVTRTEDLSRLSVSTLIDVLVRLKMP